MNVEAREKKRLAAKLIKRAKEGMIVMEETVFCPICGAASYPYKKEKWEGDPVKEPLYCGACGRDMTPTVRAMKQYMKDYVAMVRDEPVEKISEEDV